MLLFLAFPLASGCPNGMDLTAGADVLDTLDGSATEATEVADPTDTDGDPARTPPVDILVLVDTSGSMSQEQVALTLRLPALLDELTHPTDADGDGRSDHPRIADLRLGVVTQDLGSGGFSVSTCEDDPFAGDDGCLRHEPSPAVLDCDSSYPAWLSYWAEEDPPYSATELGHDFTCVATSGGGMPGESGCGIEQPLEALRRALIVQSVPGGCNEGFLRPDSLLVLIVLTDEDDMSIDPDHFDMLDPDRTDLGHLNIRTFRHPEMLTPVDEFFAAFRELRPAGSDRLVLGVIAGVPWGNPACQGSGDELEGCLGVPEMQERIDVADPTTLVPSCNTGMGVAMPPVRLVRLARQLGGSAWVGSVCETDYGPAIRGITAKIVERLEPP
ncbi:MAG: hypothetical protein HY905_10575 [Deltaproteobacteria bacterium]|nr:hypothetical protein [Deltaproteobacteria bacterium]